MTVKVVEKKNDTDDLINLSPAKQPLLQTSSWRCRHLHCSLHPFSLQSLSPTQMFTEHRCWSSSPSKKTLCSLLSDDSDQTFPIWPCKSRRQISCSCTTSAQLFKTKDIFPVLEYPKSYHIDICLSVRILRCIRPYSTFLSLLQVKGTVGHFRILNYQSPHFLCKGMSRNRKIQDPLQWIKKERCTELEHFSWNLTMM